MQLNPDFWIMRPFNLLFIAVFAAFLLVLVLLSLILRKAGTGLKTAVLVILCVGTLVGFFFYKYYLSLDADYNVITANMGGFNWWGELPLQLCNINMILIPIAVLKKSRPLMCFAFFLAPLGALMALLMPANGFDGYSLLLPRMLGYYGTHFMIVIEGLAIVTFGLYRPKYRDIPRTILATVLISLGIFCINMILRWTGLHPKANYFFSVETEGNFLLEIFHNWIPYPFLYLLPCIVILGVYMSLITLPFALTENSRERREHRRIR
ncbi:MAG: YwaF family protein, partial [Firmicutes bacterium]|nr:YwaF family protein [Bacillota bacterium]